MTTFAYGRPNPSEAYKAGFDAGLNGSNTTNTHHTHFATREQTNDWEAGQKDGKKAKANNEKGKGNKRKSNPLKK